MKILFVWPATEMSVWDVARGYRNALVRQGHDVRDYFLNKRFKYHMDHAPEEVRADLTSISRMATENVLNEALYHEAELVVICSGLNFHPVALWALGKVGIPAAVILTESPYDDEYQKQWADLSHTDSNVDLTLFTNDRFSAETYGWNFLAPAYDPEFHRKVEPVESEACDVLLIATGWRERQIFLEAVNWDGIKLRLMGVWDSLKEHSPLFPFYEQTLVDNTKIASLYASAKICLNFHRRYPEACTPNPRAYEVAACGCFQLSDPRPDLGKLFGKSVPTFETPEELETLIRYYLDNPKERLAAAFASNRLVTISGNTFDDRAKTLISTWAHREIANLKGSVSHG